MEACVAVTVITEQNSCSCVCIYSATAVPSTPESGEKVNVLVCVCINDAEPKSKCVLLFISYQ